MAFSFVLTISFLLRILIVFASAWHPDVGNHLDWGNKFWEYGPANFYYQSIWNVSWPNQPIASILLFAIISKIKTSIFDFCWYLNINYPIFPSALIPILETKLHVWLVKLPFIVSDVFTGLLIYRIVPRRKLLLSSMFLFNPIVIYNSAVWGQTDSLINFLSLAGIIYTFRQRYITGIFLFFLSFTFKMSLIFYTPVLLATLIHHRQHWQKILASIAIFTIVLLIATLPFSRNGNPFTWLLHLYQDLVFNRQGHMLSGNAFNIWSIIYGIDLSLRDNSLSFSIGMLIFTALNIRPIFLLFKHPTYDRIFTTLFLISFSSFLFLTNMHERYLYPIFPLLPLLFSSKLINLRTYSLLTIIHLLNLYNLWFYPYIPFLKLSLEANHYTIPRVLCLILIVIYFKLYRRYSHATL